MEDIVQRLEQEADYLRAVSPNGINAGAELMDEAANEIEELRSLNDAMKEGR